MPRSSLFVISAFTHGARLELSGGAPSSWATITTRLRSPSGFRVTPFVHDTGRTSFPQDSSYQASVPAPKTCCLSASSVDVSAPGCLGINHLVSATLSFPKKEPRAHPLAIARWGTLFA